MAFGPIKMGFRAYLGYTKKMKAKPMSETNPHLRDPVKRYQALRRSVISSSAIEGIDVDQLEKALPKKPNTPSKSK